MTDWSLLLNVHPMNSGADPESEVDRHDVALESKTQSITCGLPLLQTSPPELF